MIGNSICPICEQPLGTARRDHNLFGVRVCRQCGRSYLTRRILAYVVDAALLTLWAAVGIDLVLEFAIIALDHLFLVPHSALYFTLWIVPVLLRDAFWGRSPGKLIFGLQVVDCETRKPGRLLKSVLRNCVLFWPIMLAILCITYRHGHRLGDSWAKTEVIWRRHRQRSPFEPRWNICRHCNYSLVGNESGVCPECGTPTKANLTRRVMSRSHGE